MKVAISCDHILERKPVHRMIELACSMFPEATIYTLAHRPGKVLGPLEMHSIRSSFLSNVVETEEGLRKKAYLIPVAAKKLAIPCSVDLIINFSSGFSHGISHCEKTSVLNYFFSNDLNTPGKSLTEKVFKSYLKNWSIKKSEGYSHKVQSHENLHPGLEVLRPFYNFEDFMYHEKPSSGDVALINPGDLSIDELITLSDGLAEKKLRIVVLGEQIKGISGVEFLKNSCSGELAPLFEQAKIVVEGNSSMFPEFGLSSFASGRNIWVKESVISANFLGRDLPYFFNEVGDIIQNIDKSCNAQSKYRDHAARYSQLLFKTGLMRQLKNMGHPYRPKK